MIISCCGGGGLLCGIIEGMRRHKWTSIPVIAMETTGTASFNACVKSGGNPVTLDNFNGIAVSLSPVRICDKLAQYYREAKPPILSYLVEDKDAIDSCLKFADNHQFLVEPACGAALSAVYTGIAKNVLELNDCKNKPIVVIVCGGCAVSIDLLNQWKNKYLSQK
jgi:L-serine/L-threonine ammonia-lyase